MGANSKIEWTHHTFNPWIGCTHVTEACRFCYAERDWDHRFHRVKWGAHGERCKTSDENWRQPYKWDAAAEATGERKRVFCASLADIFDDHESIAPEWRAGLWKIIAETQHLDWLLLTKRPHNFPIFLPVAECRPPFEHVRLGVSLGSEKDVHFDMVGPLQFANWLGWKTFISYEPALGPIEWDDMLERGFVDWVIAGGESGPNARPAHPDWFRAARDACAKHGVPFLFKQWGEHHPDGQQWPNGSHGIEESPGQPIGFAKVGKGKSGRLLDGVEHNGFPQPAKELEAA